MQSGQPKVECFMQCRMEEAIYLMTRAEYCGSVPFDKLADGVCLFSFACYNSCLEYKNDSYHKGKLIKSGPQVLFTLLDGNRTVLREDSVDLQVCAFSTQDTPFNSCHGNSHHLTNAACPTSNAQTR